MSDSRRDLAFLPFLNIDVPPEWSIVPLPGVDLVLHDQPFAQIAHPRSDLADVQSAVAATRKLVRQHGASELIWCVTPDFDRYVEALEREGLDCRDTPGFEGTEYAMMLSLAPKGEVPAGIQVTPPLSQDDIDAAHRIMEQAFGIPDGAMDAVRDAAWAHAQDAAYPLQRMVARLDGTVVGTAAAATAPAGLNLFGAAVLESARGRGVYRAMVARRWQLAVERGTPLLTVQAGRMSRPILERLGFRVLGQVRLFNDEAVSP